MTSAIGARVDLAAVLTDLADLRSDVAELISHVDHNVESELRNEVDQNCRRALAISWRQGSTIEPLRALIVDDDHESGPLLAEAIGQLGHVVCAVEVNAHETRDPRSRNGLGARGKFEPVSRNFRGGGRRRVCARQATGRQLPPR